MVSIAQKKAVAKYQAAHYDRVNARFEKGTIDRIKAISSGSINAYIMKAVMDKLAADEAAKEFEQQMQDFMPQPEAEEDFPFN